jgi:hypothetical protein
MFCAIADAPYGVALKSGPGVTTNGLAINRASISALHSPDPEAVMDEEAKPPVDAFELERRVSATEKRFDDVRWYIGGAALIFSSLTVVLGLNVISERSALRDAIKDIREDFNRERNALQSALKDMKEEAKDALGRLGQGTMPQLLLMGTDGAPLAGQHVQANLERQTDGTAQLSFKWALINTGNSISGPVWMKLYTQKDMPTSAPSLDNPLYPYESRLQPEDLKPSNLPGKFSVTYTWRFHLPPPAPGLHGALLKAFYGNGFVSEAPFSLETQ